MNSSQLKNVISRDHNTSHVMKEFEPIFKENEFHTPITFTPQTDNLTAYCKQLCTSHLKHIIAFFNPETQDDVFIVYGFARVLDDLVDESENPKVQQFALRQAQAILDRAYALTPINQQNSFAFQLQRIVHKYQIPKKLFQQLIDGIHMDVSSDNHPFTQKQLNLYIERVSIVPGKIFNLLLREKSPIANCVVYHLFLAEQYADILLDLGKDTAKGKLYLPKEILEKYHILEATAQNIRSFPTLKAALQEIALKALTHNETAVRMLKNYPLQNKNFYEFFAKANQKMLRRMLQTTKEYAFNNVSCPKKYTLLQTHFQSGRAIEYNHMGTLRERFT